MTTATNTGIVVAVVNSTRSNFNVMPCQVQWFNSFINLSILIMCALNFFFSSHSLYLLWTFYRTSSSSSVLALVITVYRSLVPLNIIYICIHFSSVVSCDVSMSVVLSLSLSSSLHFQSRSHAFCTMSYHGDTISIVLIYLSHCVFFTPVTRIAVCQRFSHEVYMYKMNKPINWFICVEVCWALVMAWSLCD